MTRTVSSLLAAVASLFVCAQAHAAPALVGVWTASGSSGPLRWRCSFAFDQRGRYAQSCYPKKEQCGRYALQRRGGKLVLRLSQRVSMDSKAKAQTFDVAVVEANKRVRIGRQLWQRGKRATPRALELYGWWRRVGAKDGFRHAWHFWFSDFMKRGPKGTSATVGSFALVSRRGRKLVLSVTKRGKPWRKIAVTLGRDGHSAIIDGQRYRRSLRGK